METVFRLNANEINLSFLQSIKTLFQNKDVEISIKGAVDETEYLLKHPVNRKKLLKAIKNVEENNNLISFTGIEFEELTQKLLQK